MFGKKDVKRKTLILHMIIWQFRKSTPDRMRRQIAALHRMALQMMRLSLMMFLWTVMNPKSMKSVMKELPFPKST